MFGFGSSRKQQPRRKSVKFTDSHRQLIVVTTIQCRACSKIKSEITKLQSECSRRKILFVHITGNIGPDIIKKLEYHHPALRGVCKATPMVMSIMNTTKDSFDYVISPLQPNMMTAQNVIGWWLKMHDTMHDKTAKFVPHKEQKQIQPLHIGDRLNLPHDSINMPYDPINV